MSKIGIGIVTYNRLEYLKRAVEAVRHYTESSHQIVVADDGSTDGSADWCREQGLSVVTGANSGVCWNKNRALFALQASGCDPILILEDDCRPVRAGWERAWRASTAVHGHLAFAHPKILPWLLAGSGSPLDPYVNNKATAQCSSISAMALADVGFLDTRFKGYGVGHAEWTSRIKRAGFGFKRAVDPTGRSIKANLYIEGGLFGDDAPTFKDRANVARNEALFDQLKREPVYRNPWSTPEEETRFVGEMKASGVATGRYVRMMKDAASDAPDLKLRNLKNFSRAFAKLFGDRNSFVRSSGWLASIALNQPIYEGEMVPPLNVAVIELLRDRVRPHWRVFDYGGGSSTLWWSGRVDTVSAVDVSPQRTADTLELLDGDTVDIRHVPAEAFAAAIDDAQGAFDVIVVCGPERSACLAHAVPRLSPTGVLVLSNSNRSEYSEAIAQLGAQHFKELRLRAPTPGSHVSEAASIFYRRENCLDL